MLRMLPRWRRAGPFSSPVASWLCTTASWGGRVFLGLPQQKELVMAVAGHQGWGEDVFPKQRRGSHPQPSRWVKVALSLPHSLRVEGAHQVCRHLLSCKASWKRCNPWCSGGWASGQVRVKGAGKQRTERAACLDTVPMGPSPFHGV